MTPKDQSRLRLLLAPAREEEQQARRAFARARQQAEAVEEVLRRCAAALERQDQWARGASRAGGAANLGCYRQCAADLCEALLQKRAELAQVHEELESRRQDLEIRMKQRKGLEQVLRRREAAAAAEASRRSVRELDQDHAARSAWRSQTEGAAAAPRPEEKQE